MCVIFNYYILLIIIIITMYIIFTIIITGTISAVGDILCQILDTKDSNNGVYIDMKRLAIFTSVGFFYIAPLLHWWFDLLNKLPFLLFGNSISNFQKASTMIIIDQSIASFCVLSGFFYFYEFFSSIINRTSLLSFPQKATTAWSATLWPTLKANWYFWPFVNFFCFLIIPVKFQLLFSNFMATLWNMWLSGKANTASQEAAL